jgi:predicted metal-binding protein
MMSAQKIESIIESQGFLEYKWIKSNQIIVSQWVRVKCVFGCADYGLGTCPPNTPSVSDCKQFFGEYKHGLIISLKKVVDKNAYPSDWSKEMTNKLLKIERDVFLLGHPKVFLLNQTCCSLCSDCSGNRIDCKNKKNSRPSPESFAVDVYQTVRNAGLDINVVVDNPAEINRIAILMIE